MTDISRLVDPARILPLDGLRGVAAFGIALHHAFPQAFFWGWSFVDLFFVISGFVITRMLLRVESPSVRTLRNFWIRRILRIWPVYYMVLIAVIGLELVQRWLSDNAGPWPTDIVASFFFLQFVGQYGEVHVGPAYSYLPHFGHSWSLAAEEQFYVLWPFFLMLFLRVRLGLALTACVLLFALGIWLRSKGWAVYLLLTRIDGLAIGAFLAFLHHSGYLGANGLAGRRISDCVALVAAVAGVALVGPYILDGYSNPDSYLQTIFISDKTRSVAGFVLIFGALMTMVLNAPSAFLSSCLSSKPLLYVGSISYALYMLQVPVHALLEMAARRFEILHGSIQLLLYWVLIFTLAHASKILVENRFNGLKRKFSLEDSSHHPSISS